MNPGTFPFQVRVDDGRGGFDIQDYTVTVTQGALNNNPVISSSPPDSATVGFTYTYQVEAFDQNGDILFHGLTQFPQGMAIDRDTGLVSYTPTLGQEGSQPVSIQVSDRRGGLATQSFELNVVEAAENIGPEINSTPITEARIGQTYNYDVNAFDPDADGLTFELAAAPQGMAIDPLSGLIVWNPVVEQIGNQRVVSRVNDGRGGTDVQVFDVLTQGENSIPVIISLPVTNATANALYQYPVLAIDAENDTLTFSLNPSSHRNDD